MMLYAEYRADLLDHVREEPDKTFEDAGLSKTAVLEDSDSLDRMWVLYQKFVTEYGVEPYQAFREVLSDVLHVPVPQASADADDGEGNGGRT